MNKFKCDIKTGELCVILQTYIQECNAHKKGLMTIISTDLEKGEDFLTILLN